MNFGKIRKLFFLSVGLIVLFNAAFVVAQDDDEEGATELTDAYDYQMIGGVLGRLEAHGDDLMGDQIDKRTGALVFSHTDISIPGNSSLEVALRRKHTQGAKYYSPYQQAFGDWVLDLPVAYFTYGIGSGINYPTYNDGCITDTGNISRDYTIAGANFISGVHREGLLLQVPGRATSGFQGRISNGLTDPKNNWVSGGQETDHLGRCVEVSIAPDGTKYKFGIQATRKAKTITAPYQYNSSGSSRDEVEGEGSYGDTGWAWAGLDRRHSVLLVTEVEDIHGNWVRYEYTSGSEPELTRIHSNDLREINLHYDSVASGSNRNSRRVTHATAHGLQWDYQYSGDAQDTYRNLEKAELPDGRYWDFGTGSFTMNGMLYETYEHWDCVPTDRSVSMKHPDGAVGSFTLRETRHIKSIDTLVGKSSDAPKARNFGPPTETDSGLCWGGYTTNGQEPLDGHAFYRTMSVTEKEITSANTPTATWTFDYRGYAEGNTNEHWSAAGITQGYTNLDQTWTMITGPDGTKRTYTFQNIGRDHGLLKRLDVSSASGAVLENFTYEYNTSQDMPADCEAGGEYGDQVGACFSYAKRPQSLVQHQRDGVTYRTEKDYDFSNGAFVDYGRPNTITRWSTLQGQGNARVSELEYWHNLSLNIIGLPKKLTRNNEEFVENFYNSKGQKTSVEKFGQSGWLTFTYDTDGTVKTIKDPLNKIATLTNYKRGQPRHITKRDGVLLEREVNDLGWVTSETNGRGYTTSYGYTDGGWLSRVTPPSPWDETVVTYHNLGTSSFYRKIVKGRTETIEWYDHMLRFRKERQRATSGGGKTSYVATNYDALGRAVFESLPSPSSNPSLGKTTVYDGLGRVTGTAENFGLFATTEMQYLSDNRILSKDELNNTTITTRSGYGSPEDGQVTFIDQPEDVNTQMTYDIFGNILSARQFGNGNGHSVDSTQTWIYNDRMLPCVHRTPETGSKVFIYDAAGQVRHYGEGLGTYTSCPSSVPSGNRVVMAYDEVGRTKSINYPGSTTDVVIEYDENGNVTKNTRGDVVWEYGYNSADLLDWEQLRVDAKVFDLDYTYYSSGSLRFRTLPSGRDIEFTYNGLEQILSVTSDGKSYASNFAYHENGMLGSMLYGNGYTFTQTLNTSQQPQRVTAQLAHLKAIDLEYDYDARRNVTSIIDWKDRNFDRSMTYDDLGRLETAQGDWGLAEFDYDSLGNLRRKEIGNRVVNISYNNTLNRATQSTDTQGSTRAIEYDARGNVDKLGGLNFIYDMANQPTIVSGSSNGTYTYDGNFKRVVARVDGKVIYNVYDSAGVLVHVDEVEDGTSNIQVCFESCGIVIAQASQTTDYINLSSVSIRLENDSPTYIHNDLLGSPVAATGADGSILWEEHYTPFGEKWVRAAANDDQGSYTGHIFDSDTELTYMQARYYDPVIGRFLSNDPIGFIDHIVGQQGPQGFNRYAYVNNNPFKFTDPLGMCSSDQTENSDNSADDPCSDLPQGEDEKSKFVIGLKHNEYGDVIICIGASACSAPSNVSDASLKAFLAATADMIPMAKRIRMLNKVAKKEKVHGNSKSSDKPQHLYAIIDTRDASIYKYGISGAELNKNGTSSRANVQANALNNIHGDGTYKATVLLKNIPGRLAALAIERSFVYGYAAVNGAKPIGNKRP